MKKTFNLNGIDVVAKEVDFNLVCDLDELGVSLESIGTKPMNALRGYVAVCIGGSLADAGMLLQEHMVNGGTIEEVLNVFVAKMEESDFFRQISKMENKETPKTTKKATTKKTVTE